MTDNFRLVIYLLPRQTPIRRIIPAEPPPKAYHNVESTPEFDEFFSGEGASDKRLVPTLGSYVGNVFDELEGILVSSLLGISVGETVGPGGSKIEGFCVGGSIVDEAMLEAGLGFEVDEEVGDWDSVCDPRTVGDNVALQVG